MPGFGFKQDARSETEDVGKNMARRTENEVGFRTESERRAGDN